MSCDCDQCMMLETFKNHARIIRDLSQEVMLLRERLDEMDGDRRGLKGKFYPKYAGDFSYKG